MEALDCMSGEFFHLEYGEVPEHIAQGGCALSLEVFKARLDGVPEQTDLVLDLAVDNSACSKGVGTWFEGMSGITQAVLGSTYRLCESPFPTSRFFSLGSPLGQPLFL